MTFRDREAVVAVQWLCRKQIEKSVGLIIALGRQITQRVKTMTSLLSVVLSEVLGLPKTGSQTPNTSSAGGLKRSNTCTVKSDGTLGRKLGL